MKSFRLYSDIPDLPRHKVWAEIDTHALRYNYKLLCSMTPGVEHICVVKADSYGHISSLCVGILLDSGCRFFAVSCIEEAISVRKICAEREIDAQILILGYTNCAQAQVLAKNNIIQTIISKEYAIALNQAAKLHRCKVRTHVAIDTGMNRIGLCAQTKAECRSVTESIIEITQLENLSLEGMFTHFARADEEYEATVSKNSHVRKQFARFDTVRKMLLEQGLKLFCHACNSAASVRFPEFALDGVRFGILLYGVCPSKHVDVCVKPVMSLYAVISHLHKLNVGEAVSYGGHFSSDEERTLATLPIGYADGFLRAFSGFDVTVRTSSGDFKAPVVGNVCMDQCVIDVTGIPAAAGDKVTIFGNDRMDLSRLAELANTIEYEILCLISARVPRIAKNKTFRNKEDS